MSLFLEIICVLDFLSYSLLFSVCIFVFLSLSLLLSETHESVGKYIFLFFFFFYSKQGKRTVEKKWMCLRDNLPFNSVYCNFGLIFSIWKTLKVDENQIFLLDYNCSQEEIIRTKIEKKLQGFPNWGGKHDKSILKYQNETSALKTMLFMELSEQWRCNLEITFLLNLWVSSVSHLFSVCTPKWKAAPRAQDACGAVHTSLQFSLRKRSVVSAGKFALIKITDLKKITSHNRSKKEEPVPQQVRPDLSSL